MPEVQSDVIERVRYSHGRLAIWFRPSGRLYVYQDVPEAIYRALLEAPSKGAYFNAHIRDSFSFTLEDRR